MLKVVGLAQNKQEDHSFTTYQPAWMHRLPCAFVTRMQVARITYDVPLCDQNFSIYK